MKHLSLIILVCVVLLAGCKKDKDIPQSIIGKWELRNMLGGQLVVPSNYQPGSRSIIQFSENEFQWITNGKVTRSGTYKIIDSAADIDGTTYSKAIIYNNENLEWYVKISGNKLMLNIGTIALDGATWTYQRL